MSSMTAPQRSPKETDAVTGAGGCDKTPFPEVFGDQAAVDTTLEPSRLFIRLDGNGSQQCHANLDASEGSQTGTIPVAAISGQKIDAVGIAVLHLVSLLATIT